MTSNKYRGLYYQKTLIFYEWFTDMDIKISQIVKSLRTNIIAWWLFMVIIFYGQKVENKTKPKLGFVPKGGEAKLHRRLTANDSRMFFPATNFDYGIISDEKMTWNVVCKTTFAVCKNCSSVWNQFNLYLKRLIAVVFSMHLDH